jgi:hypothetical protein
LPDVHVITRPSAELTQPEERELQMLCERAWVAKGSAFRPVAWQAARGGRHFIIAEAGGVVAVMRAVTRFIDQRYELGALDTATPEFYERLDWVRWPGRTAVRTPESVRLTPEEDGKVLVHFTGTSLELREDGLLVCDGRRPGDPW